MKLDDRRIDMAPPWLRGLWRRESIVFPDGTTDLTTRVFWGQTRTLFVDIRIPPRPSFPLDRAGLDRFMPEEHRLLARQKGFAGHILLKGDLCEWIRLIDYQPSTGRPDIGRLRLEGDTLYEEGDPSSSLGSAYIETFHRVCRGEGVSVALRLAACGGIGFEGSSVEDAILVLLDDWFLFARSRSAALPAGESLTELVDAAGTDRLRICGYLDCELSLGQVKDGEFPWRIELSTLPRREGQRLFAPSRSAVDPAVSELTLAGSNGASSWKIMESNLPLAALVELFDM